MNNIKGMDENVHWRGANGSIRVRFKRSFAKQLKGTATTGLTVNSTAEGNLYHAPVLLNLKGLNGAAPKIGSVTKSGELDLQKGVENSAGLPELLRGLRHAMDSYVSIKI